MVWRSRNRSKQELSAEQDCLDEAFWARSVPSGLVSGSLAIWAIKTGRIKAGSRFTSRLALVAGAGSLGYILGQTSFFLSRSCDDIILKKAPDSELAAIIRDLSASDRESRLDTAKIRFLHHLNSPSYIDSLMALDRISDIEIEIQEDCNNIAIYKYSIPLSIISGGSTYLTMREKWLNHSKIFKPYPKLPTVLFGSMIGFIAGQLIYQKSGDCAKRHLLYDPNGNISRLLREDAELIESCDRLVSEEPHLWVLGEPEKKDGSDLTNAQDYVFPRMNCDEDLQQALKESWTNPLDIYVKRPKP